MSYATSNAFIIINHEDAFFAATDMLFLIRNTERAQYLYFAPQPGDEGTSGSRAGTAAGSRPST